jgi:1-carboxybiuret hydrolase subunit AtzG-like protein
MRQGDDNPLEAYVRAALALQGYAFDDAEIAEIVVQFSRLETIARTVFDCPLPFASAPAPVFRP